ncbi:MAG: hypothetical protein LBL01_02435 [Bifidobacteriaceae bacterium]|nr:hypothetical protein [Bifidobacteriaceae bacterium]
MTASGESGNSSADRAWPVGVVGFPPPPGWRALSVAACCLVVASGLAACLIDWERRRETLLVPPVATAPAGGELVWVCDSTELRAADGSPAGTAHVKGGRAARDGRIFATLGLRLHGAPHGTAEVQLGHHLEVSGWGSIQLVGLELGSRQLTGDPDDCAALVVVPEPAA